MKKQTILLCAIVYSVLNVRYALQTGHGGFMPTLALFFLVVITLYATTRFIWWAVSEMVYHYRQRRLLAQPTYDQRQLRTLPSVGLIVEADQRRFDPHINVDRLTKTLAMMSQREEDGSQTTQRA